MIYISIIADIILKIYFINEVMCGVGDQEKRFRSPFYLFLRVWSFMIVKEEFFALSRSQSFKKIPDIKISRFSEKKTLNTQSCLAITASAQSHLSNLSVFILI